jgi:hypothetical protein
MTANPSIDPASVLAEHLARAEPERQAAATRCRAKHGRHCRRRVVDPRGHGHHGLDGHTQGAQIPARKIICTECGPDGDLSGSPSRPSPPCQDGHPA